MPIFRATVVDRAGRESEVEIQSADIAEAEDQLKRGGYVWSNLRLHRDSGLPSRVEPPVAPRVPRTKRKIPQLRAGSQRCFRVYYAPDVLRVLWLLGFALLVLAALIYPINRLIDAVNRGNLGYAFADWQFYITPLTFLCMAIGFRITLESVGVLFDILAELRKMNARAAESERLNESL